MTRITARFARLTGGIIAGAIVLTGCADSEDSPSSESSGAGAESSAGQSAFNNTDVTFVQGMIPHHRGALEMAQLAEGRAEDPRVLQLASRIEAAQDPEIETMLGWLEAWGEPLPEEADSGMDHGSGGMDHGSGGTGMEGMSDADMASLEAASGAEFDRMFLELMVEHHRGAVDMAETEVADGTNADAVEMARQIVESQTAEIAEMETLLDQIGA